MQERAIRIAKIAPALRENESINMIYVLILKEV